MKLSPAAVSSPPLWAACLLALAGGALVPIAFAPFDIWPLALLGMVSFALLLYRRSGGRACLLAFCFGLGLYGVGVSWIFVSIHTYGNASAPLAALLTGLFVAFVALIFSLPFYIYGRWFSHRPLALALAFPALWLLGEWLRSWLLTGFPWLYLGYGHLESWLAGWAPVLGVMGLSLIVALSAGLIAQWLMLWRTGARPKVSLYLLTLVVVCFWPGGLALKQVSWTQLDRQAPISVAMVQPNIAQELKWNPDYVQPTLDLLLSMSEDLWQNDWLIWPEASIPEPYHHTLPFLDQINRLATETETGLIAGIIYDDPHRRRYYNSVVGFGEALGIYHKRRLVPFGEYVPLEDWLRGLIHFFDMPTSIIDKGPWEQQGIQVGEIGIAPTVCYEVVYPDLVAASARSSQVLLTVSNDAWFADSIGPLQHMQMARMRALETGRYLIRSTNNGVSAIVDPEGQIRARSEQFVAQVLEAEVYPAQGWTPFMRWGSPPLAVASALILALLLLFRRRSKSNPEISTESSSHDGARADSKTGSANTGEESTPDSKSEPEPKKSPQA